MEFPRELGNFDAATESFQKALLLNQNHVQTLQLKGMMLYHHGSLDEALKNFKVCSVRPTLNKKSKYFNKNEYTRIVLKKTNSKFYILNANKNVHLNLNTV